MNLSVVILFISLWLPLLNTPLPADVRLNHAKSRLVYQAPNFTLSDIHGKKFTLKDFRGKVVILNFWYTSCSPCIAEMPVLNTLTKKYDPARVIFLSITFNNAPQVISFLKHHKFSYHALVDGKKVCETYHVQGFPTHIVIDQKGDLVGAQMGTENIKQVLEQTINKILKTGKP